jgi:hypothetical protein
VLQCALAGKTAERWVCLDFFAPLFASRQKVENKLHSDVTGFKKQMLKRVQHDNNQYAALQPLL